MDVMLLGTGSADGWPSPFCSCRSCRWALTAGEIRGQTAALVDDVLLIDCGPEVPRAALRAGRTLAAVRHILLTHGHFDHVGPAALVMRHWVGRTEPLDVIGPPGALDQCRDWVGPDDPIRFRAVYPGEELTLPVPGGAYTVRVVAAAHTDALVDDAVLYDVSRGDTRLLWATDTGPLPDATHAAIAAAGFDAVFLEETFGPKTDHGTDHHDLPSFARTLTQMRESGAIGDHTDVVAVHLSHFNLPGPELSTALTQYGARAGRDGEVVRVGTRRSPVASPTSRTLVLGGVRSGKSVHAEGLLAGHSRVRYLAAGGPRHGDPEWAQRVRQHRARRPPEWHTVESSDVAGQLRTAQTPVLLDCLGTWLAARMDRHGCWDSGQLVPVHDDIDEVVAAWRQCTVTAVAVSNEVGSGIVPDTASGRIFRDLLGMVNMRIAAECDDVLLMVAGVAIPLRG
ncbi:adenosylcobinamide kinase [Mycobacterium sp. NS-7484]|uniref:bifunctional adenosylcobinamide kinase/adenosylcobinamide-phosphate guanylyltransferase n=1 Tax=Mycobacterium sp. NS-7484 TaxID=1834161 RepID=UPI00096C11F8|nr:bifunctional adenosylcobinamide kinase/adenosylcobinamide-phosphate guanylyltransferase [Mycobacterium sp. NS-7484]OMC00488.1 adenosylcobinamide kinase [Mycobacterium sp. NS-7484]